MPEEAGNNDLRTGFAMVNSLKKYTTWKITLLEWNLFKLQTEFKQNGFLKLKYLMK